MFSVTTETKFLIICSKYHLILHIFKNFTNLRKSLLLGSTNTNYLKYFENEVHVFQDYLHQISSIFRIWI